MKTVRLNLEDKQSWQKFQHVLTSFVSDYIDLVAPEQTEFKFESQVLSLSFTLINTNPDRERANVFTHRLEQFLKRLQLISVRQVELEFLNANAEVALLSYSFELPLLKPQPTEASTALARRSQAGAVQRRTAGSIQRSRGFGGLVENVRGWLTNPELLQAIKDNSRIALRNPKRVVNLAQTAVKDKASAALTWVDTFPWESWFNAKLEWQKRRHRRNLVKALVEDFVLVTVVAIALYFGMDFLSGPSIKLAAMPAQHIDFTFASASQGYRCGNPAINKKNYLCLQRGMSYDQVNSILGSKGTPLGIANQFSSFNSLEPSKDKLEDKAVIVAWRNGEGTLNGTFRGDKLVAKAYRNLP